MEDEMSGGGTNIGHKLIDFGPRIFLLHLQVLEVDRSSVDFQYPSIARALRADIRALFYRARTYSLEGDGSSDRSVPLERNHVQRISCYVNDASGDGDWISERG